MTSSLNRLAAGVAAATLAAAVSGPLRAQPAELSGAPLPAAQSQHGIAYLNGGVGADAQDAMKAARAGYNLHLTFANRTGEYRANVQVDIWDGQGQQRFSLADAGPLLYVRLPPGSYRVMASSAGQRYERSVRLGASGALDLAFTWAPEPEPEAGGR